MKYLILICGVLTALSLTAQDQTTIETLEDDVLYRGYTNKVTIQVSKDEDRTTELHGENVSITRDKASNTYIVKPMKGKTATLSVQAVEGKTVETLYTKTYHFRNLPDPDVYWGESKSGGTGNITSKKLSIRYHESVNLPNDFRIVGWEIQSDSKVIQGVGNDMSSAESFLKTVEDGTVLQLIVKILSPDGITRMKAAQWEVQSWKDEEKLNPLKFDR